MLAFPIWQWLTALTISQLPLPALALILMVPVLLFKPLPDAEAVLKVGYGFLWGGLNQIMDCNRKKWTFPRWFCCAPHFHFYFPVSLPLPSGPPALSSPLHQLCSIPVPQCWCSVHSGVPRELGQRMFTTWVWQQLAYSPLHLSLPFPHLSFLGARKSQSSTCPSPIGPAIHPGHAQAGQAG